MSETQYRVTLDYSSIGVGVLVDVSFWADSESLDSDLEQQAKAFVLTHIGSDPRLDEIALLQTKED